MSTKAHGYDNSKELSKLNKSTDGNNKKAKSVHGSDFSKELNQNLNVNNKLSTGYKNSKDLDKNLNASEVLSSGFDHNDELNINVNSESKLAKKEKVIINLYKDKKPAQNIGINLGNRN